MHPSTLPGSLASAALVLILLIWAVPAGNGLRCRFYMARETPAASHPGGPRVPGLVRREYATADFASPSATGTEPNVNREWIPDPGFHDRSYRWSGWIHLPASGTWSLGTESDDGSLVVVDGLPMVSNWGEHRELTRWGRRLLDRGDHSITVDYFQHVGTARIRLLWCPPGGKPGLVPPDALWHQVPDVTAAGPTTPTTAAGSAAAGAPAAAGRDTAAKDTAAKDTAAKDTAAKDTAAKDTAAKDIPPKDTAAKNSAPKDTAAKDSPPKDTVSKNSGPKDTAAKDSSGTDAAAKDAAGWDVDRLAVSPATEPWETTGTPGDLPGWSWTDHWAGWQPELVVQAGAGRSEGSGAMMGPFAADRMWRGWVKLDSPAHFLVHMVRPALGLVWVDGRLVLGAPGAPAPGTRQAAVDLSAGWHRLRVATTRASGTAPPVAFDVHGSRGPGRPLEVVSSPSMIEPSLPILPATHPDPLAETISSWMRFLPDTRLMAPYLYRWDVRRFGHPSVVGALRATWDGVLRAPRDGLYTLTVAGTGQCRLRVGSYLLYKGTDTRQASMKVALSTDGIPLELEVSDPGLIRYLDLVWVRPGAKNNPETIPASALSPPDARNTRRWQALGTLVLLVVVALALYRLNWRRYGHFLRRHAVGHAWVSIVLLGAAFHLHEYQHMPRPGDTFDEYNHVMMGTSLVNGTLPFGWEWHKVFPVIRAVPLYGHLFKLCVPMVFYPPGFSYITGLVNRAAGATSPFEARLDTLRLLPILLSLFTLFMILPLSRALGLPDAAALLAGLFLAVYPPGVLLHRLVKEENLMAPLYLMLVYTIAGYRTGSGPGRRALMGALIVACVLTKQPGIASMAFAFLALAAAGHYAAAGTAVLYGVLGVGLFFWYGLAWGGYAFLALQKELMTFATRIDALWPMLAENRLTDYKSPDAWLLGLWMAFFLFAARRHASSRARLLVLAIVCYLFVLVPSYPSHLNFGWYRIPLLPLLALCWGAETLELTRSYDAVRALFWVGLFVLPSCQVLRLQEAVPLDSPVIAAALSATLATSGPQPPTVLLRLFILGLGLPALFLPMLAPRVRRLVALLFGVTVIMATAAGFMVITWHWSAIIPYSWQRDPVMPVDPAP